MIDLFALGCKTIFQPYPLLLLFLGTVAGIISAFILMFFTPPLANVALKFGPWEFFSLVLFGLTIIASLAGKSLTKGLIL
ncbi:MAG: tripartite tricarboxylate transporter permease, partial [Deltaproteobacteria bacterium]|nr:tripartite tricarboxylate transporter permease [Deltaproteobacteria bacterium]